MIQNRQLKNTRDIDTRPPVWAWSWFIRVWASGGAWITYAKVPRLFHHNTTASLTCPTGAVGVNKNMMNEDLITRLIQQDLKHNQLLQGLEKLGFSDIGLQSLELMTIVFELMKVTPKKRDLATSIYIMHMNQAKDYPISGNGKELRKLAEECCTMLKA